MKYKTITAHSSESDEITKALVIEEVVCGNFSFKIISVSESLKLQFLVLMKHRQCSGEDKTKEINLV